MRPRIRELREAHKPRLTQKALAENAGVAERTVQHFEAGTKEPRIDTARKIAAALGCGLVDLFDDTAA